MKNRLIFAAVVLWNIAQSVVWTVLLSLPLFWLDVGWEGLAHVAGLSAGRLFHNYLVLINYLLNPFQAKLAMPDFPDSAPALQHFAEVKTLFLLCLALAILLLPALMAFIKRRLYFDFRVGIRLAMAAPVLLAFAALLMGFENFFVAFHKVLFRDNTWLFDPSTDPIINVLTESFFMYCFIIFAIIYLGTLSIFMWKGRLRRKDRAQKAGGNK